MPHLKQTICLNMIVRNESRVIERCLNSVKGFVDHWVIVDTGSTDGTQQLVRQCLGDLPGELIERPWVDFAYNRSEALELARGTSDYIFVIDADEQLVTDADFSLAELDRDAYYLKIHSHPIVFWRLQLFKNAPGWRYEGAVHEYLTGPENINDERLNGIWIVSRTDGARAAEPGVYQRDVEQLLRAHREAPDDSRSVFYLAQSYAAAGEPELALQYFQRRVELGGWPEEVWCAKLQIAELKLQLDRDWSEVQQAYLDAFQFRPSRAEPLYRIAVHYRWQGAFHLAHLFLQRAAGIPYPADDYLFLDERHYHYLVKMALATCCYHLGSFDEGLRLCDELLQDRRRMPPNIYDQVMVNRQQCAAKATEVYARTVATRPKVKVFVQVCDPGPSLDNGIERLLKQNCDPFEIVFVDLGSKTETVQKLPVDDPRVTVVHLSESISKGETFWEMLAGRCDPDDIGLILNANDWLVTDAALAQLQQCFADPECLVTYGQFQYADGSAGLACFIADIDGDRMLVDDWRCTFPLAFRGRVLRQILDEDPEFVIKLNSEGETSLAGWTVDAQPYLARKLFAVAGAAGVRFNPHPICVFDPDRSRPTASTASVRRHPGKADLPDPLPLISCLTVTQDRLVLLKEAIICYCEQTYPNRELVIVTDGTSRFRQAIDDYLTWLGRSDIRLIYVETKGQSLGALRNIALDAALGTIVCQWDDDDLNHPERLERQFSHLNESRADACCFTDQLQFFFEGRTLFWSNWRNGELHGTDQLIPGTLMTFRDRPYRYPEIGLFAGAGEDSVLLEQIAANGTVAPFRNAGYLNIYSYHGRNVFPEIHHRRIAVSGSQSAGFMREQEATLRDALRHYRLPKPYRVTAGDGQVMFIEN